MNNLINTNEQKTKAISQLANEDKTKVKTENSNDYLGEQILDQVIYKEENQEQEIELTPCIFEAGVEQDVEKALFDQFIQEQIENGAELLNAKDLINMQVQEYPFLIEDLIPKRCISAIVAPSEAGKSSLAYQLCEAVVSGKDCLGKKVNPSSNNVLFIPTEEGNIQAALKLKKQLNEQLERKEVSIDVFESFQFAFNIEDVYYFISEFLTYREFDLIVIDCYGDVNLGDNNSVSDTRKFMNLYHKLTQTYNTSIVFLHHINKASSNTQLTKNSIIGSTGFVDKTRHVIGLEANKEDPRHVVLKTIKSNLMSFEDKKKHINLYLNDNLKFELVDSSKQINPIATKQSTIRNEEKIRIVLEQKKLGISQQDIVSKLKDGRYKTSQSAVSKMIKEYQLDENNFVVKRG